MRSSCGRHQRDPKPRVHSGEQPALPNCETTCRTPANRPTATVRSRATLVAASGINDCTAASGAGEPVFPQCAPWTRLISAADRKASVKRRSVLGLFAALLSAGCVDRWPTPTGPRAPPEQPEGQPRDPDTVQIDTWDFDESDSGQLRVFGTVENDGTSAAQATVEVVVSTDEEKYEQSQTVDVPAEGDADFNIVLDIEYEAFLQSGSITLELQ